MTAKLEWQPARDDASAVQALRQRLMLDRRQAIHLASTTLQICRDGHYRSDGGRRIELAEQIEHALAAKESVPPDEPLQLPDKPPFESTRVQVVNDTTLAAARELVGRDERTAALNFANGVHPGGGFLNGALAQEESLCRASALYPTLEDDPMYAAHARQARPESSGWIIRSPDVPVFRSEDGRLLDAPWQVTFLTCAAPYAPAVGQPRSHELLDTRIARLLQFAASRGHSSLVLGAWGCGAFRNDPEIVAGLFGKHLEHFAGYFREVVFAVVDWSEARHTFRPFAEALSRTH